MFEFLPRNVDHRVKYHENERFFKYKLLNIHHTSLQDELIKFNPEKSVEIKLLFQRVNYPFTPKR